MAIGFNACLRPDILENERRGDPGIPMGAMPCVSPRILPRLPAPTQQHQVSVDPNSPPVPMKEDRRIKCERLPRPRQYISRRPLQLLRYENDNDEISPGFNADVCAHHCMVFLFLSMPVFVFFYPLYVPQYVYL